tara:strand:+ start:30163 stop:31014 length:852 start_codon:yes stop_codon:yes gene_type:complete
MRSGAVPVIAPPSGSRESNDLNVLTVSELTSVFQQSTPGGDRQINGIKLPVISGTKLMIAGDAYIRGIIKTPLQLAHGIRFPDGNVSAPSIAFINAPGTGIYRDAGGAVAIAVAGANKVVINNTLLVTVPITTPTGSNLVLNPDGPAVDFSGKTLINVGGFSADPNRYESIGPTVTTTGAASTSAINLPTVLNSAYTITIDVTCANITDNLSSGSFILTVRAKNNGNTLYVVTLGTESSRDPATANCSVAIQPAGTNISVIVSNTTADTIKWRAVATITRQLY